MEIRVATICDFAQVREGLLSVISAGVTRLWRSQYPAPLGVMVALIFELVPGSASIPREVRFRVENADGARLAEAVGAIQVDPSPGLDPGETVDIATGSRLPRSATASCWPLSNRHRSDDRGYRSHHACLSCRLPERRSQTSVALTRSHSTRAFPDPATKPFPQTDHYLPSPAAASAGRGPGEDGSSTRVNSLIGSGLGC